MTEQERTQQAMNLYGQLQQAIMASPLDPVMVMRILAATMAAISLSVNKNSKRPQDPHLLAASIGDDLARTIIEVSEGGDDKPTFQ